MKFKNPQTPGRPYDRGQIIVSNLLAGIQSMLTVMDKLTQKRNLTDTYEDMSTYIATDCMPVFYC